MFRCLSVLFLFPNRSPFGPLRPLRCWALGCRIGGGGGSVHFAQESRAARTVCHKACFSGLSSISPCVRCLSLSVCRTDGCAGVERARSAAGLPVPPEPALLQPQLRPEAPPLARAGGAPARGHLLVSGLCRGGRIELTLGRVLGCKDGRCIR